MRPAAAAAVAAMGEEHMVGLHPEPERPEVPDQGRHVRHARDPPDPALLQLQALDVQPLRDQLAGPLEDLVPVVDGEHLFRHIGEPVGPARERHPTPPAIAAPRLVTLDHVLASSVASS